MNFAFVTVVLILVSLPGIVIRRSYFSSKFSSSYVTTNWATELVWSFIPAVFIHSIAILIIERHSDFLILIEHLGYLLVGGNERLDINQIFQEIHSQIGNILIYFVCISSCSAIIGHLARRLVRWSGLDISVRSLRFPNRWHYIFTGEYLDIDNGWKYHKKIDFITVDVLMSTGHESILYSGKLEDYYLSKSKGGLDRIIIKYPSKKLFTPDGKSEYRDIPGNYLVVPYDNIINLNINYFSIDDLEYDGGDENGGDDDDGGDGGSSDPTITDSIEAKSLVLKELINSLVEQATKSTFQELHEKRSNREKNVK